MNYRKQRGEAIANAKNQIRRVNDSTYVVRSQTVSDTKYTLEHTVRGWDCSCPDRVQFCKHAYAVECRLGPKARADRGLMIYKSGGQVERIAPDYYVVKSQGAADTSYEVRNFGSGWMCSCPDHLYTGERCKHVQAVEFEAGSRIVIKPHDNTKCKFCGSSSIVKHGMNRGKQRFLCKECGRKFVQNLGFEGKHATPEVIITAVEMIYAGLSTRKTSGVVRNMGIKASRQTVLNWATEYGELMEKLVDEITPNVGETWRTDEVYVKIRGERKYLFAMLDSDTRYWIARQVATHKGTDDVKPMFRKAKQVAGKVPSKLISDGAANFAEAHHDEYAPKNFLWKGSIHESHIRMDGDINNNQMESFNGNTIRLREKVTCGLKKDDSAILTGLQLYHNFVRPHLGLPEHSTPSEATGIIIEGNSRIATLIQAATKAGMNTE